MNEYCYLGEIRLFAGIYAPVNWAFCDGSLITITQQTQAFFSIIGNTYGGDGRTNFNLPDLRSRVPVCTGQGNSLSPYQLGQKVGAESVTLPAGQLPAHTHSVLCNGATPPSNVNTPANNFFAAGPLTFIKKTPIDMVYATTTDGSTMNSDVIQSAGGFPINIIQPSLGLNYIICTYGLYPNRD